MLARQDLRLEASKGFNRDPAFLRAGSLATHAFITGGGGFLANHLARDLLAQGHEVTVLMRRQAADGLPQKARVVHGDLLLGPFPLIPPSADVVYHLAAKSSTVESVAAPAETLEVNVMGTARLLEEARARPRKLRRFVLASTGQVYGPPFRGRLREAHPAVPRNPYSASKHAAETLAVAYDGLFDVPVTVLRLFNIYGPGQRAEYVIPSVLSQCIEQTALKIGNPWPVRDFVFVDDAVAMFRLAGLDRKSRRQTVNVGTGEGVRVDRMVALAVKVTGCGLKPAIESDRKRPNDFDRLVSDPSKARRLYRWRPQVSLEEGLRRTADALRAGARARAEAGPGPV